MSAFTKSINPARFSRVAADEWAADRQLPGRQISLSRLGVQPGQNVGAVINYELQNNPPGIAITVPPCGGNDYTDSWLLEEPLVGQDAFTILGEGNRENCVLMRPGTNLALSMVGGAAGTSDPAILSNIFIRSVTLHGGGRGYDFWEMLNCGLCGFENLLVIGVAGGTTGGRILNIKGQVQDSWWRDVYFGGGGSVDGSIGSVEISDDLSVGGHVQNLLFSNCDWEGYEGTALKIYGSSDLGLNPSLIDIVDCKMESPNRSNVPDLDILTGKRIYIRMRQIVSKGTSGDKTAIIRGASSSVSQITVRGHFVHSSGGAKLINVANFDAATDLDIDLSLDTTTANYCDANAVVSLSTSLRNKVFVNNPGTKNPCSFQQTRTLYNTAYTIAIQGPVFGTLKRTDSAGTVSSSNRSIQVQNASTSHYFGFDANNKFCGSASIDLSASLFRLDPTNGEILAAIHRVGNSTGPTWTSDTGTPEGKVIAPVGSLYSRRDGGASSTLYVKESGTGNTGWVPK